ncbi:plastocyanin [Caulobacter sp. BK020]|nr:plastocyanin [Caulobacter sp. BK020]
MKMLVSMMALAATLTLAGEAVAQAEQTVVMSNMSYGKLPAGLKVGDTITWTNRDTVPHTVTARDHSFDLRVAPGRSTKMTLTKAGAFPFFCTYHTMMRGTLTVAPK